METNEKNKRRFILLLKKIKKIICYNKIRNRKKNKMNKKIYNNLNIENLIKTNSFKQLTVEEKEVLLKNSQWFNQFDEFQQEEILEGLKSNVDVSIYANLEFDWRKMEQIRLGLEDNLNVSLYVKPKFNNYQMREIRLGLKKELNISIYAKSEFNYRQMEAIREGLESNVDVSIYAKKEYNFMQMAEILTGLFTKVDVSIYANPDLDYEQMREIRNETYKDYYDEYVLKIMEENRKIAKNNEQNTQ